MRAFFTRDPDVIRAVSAYELAVEEVHRGRRELSEWAGRDLACKRLSVAGAEVPVGFVATPAEHEDSIYTGIGPRTLYYSVKHAIVMPNRQVVTGQRIRRELVSLRIYPVLVPGVPTTALEGGRLRAPDVWLGPNAVWAAFDTTSEVRRVDASRWRLVDEETYWSAWASSHY